MADTVESLRIELDALRQEFDEFRAYAQPVIDGHQPPEHPPIGSKVIWPFPDSPTGQAADGR
jgi:hypothetical protein